MTTPSVVVPFTPATSTVTSGFANFGLLTSNASVTVPLAMSVVAL